MFLDLPDPVNAFGMASLTKGLAGRYEPLVTISPGGTGVDWHL
jgi:hypothetical protein